MLGTGSDTFQLGGTGAASFDVSQIGAAAQYQGFGTFNKIDSSVWTLTGTSTFAGPVNVNGGTLSVNGNISSASGVTVNAGGTLGGNGIVGNTTDQRRHAGAGQFDRHCSRCRAISCSRRRRATWSRSRRANADRTNVTGTATLGGATVNASFAAGQPMSPSNTPSSTRPAASAARFGAPVNTNLPANFTSA